MLLARTDRDPTDERVERLLDAPDEADGELTVEEATALAAEIARGVF